jgi:hypothetical protein
VEVPDPLQNRLRVRRVPSHRLAVGRPRVRVRIGWDGEVGEARKGRENGGRVWERE